MRNIEHNTQIACVRWFRYVYPKFIIFAVPNGGWRNPVVAVKLKAEGVLAGVSDLIILTDEQTIFVEMKTKKGYQSPHQKAFQEHVTELGYAYTVCHSFEEFATKIPQIIQDTPKVFVK